jgi:DNA-binding NarL/FixJ family response regulator
VEGLSNQEIADRLILSVETVKTHMRHIMEKLAVSDRTQAAVKAMREGLV